MKHPVLLCGLLLPAVCCSISLGQTAPTSRPSYTLPRFDENYSFLQDPALRTDFFDPIKYIPLGNQDDWYASFGGQVRDRYEYFNHNLFGTGPQTRDGFNLTRVTENLDLHLGPNVRIFLQGASAFETGRDGGPRPADRDELDLEQGFGEFTIPLSGDLNVDLRAGRQYLKFGAERLLGISDYNNVRRTFDGFRADLDSPNNSMDFLIFRPVLVEPYKFDSSDDKNALAGIYDILKLPDFMPDAKTQLELYALFLDRLNATVPTRAGAATQDLYTLGARFSSNPKPFDFDVECDYQLGNLGNNNIAAYSLATKDGYTFEEAPLRPRLFIGSDIASGANKMTGTIGTFNQLYPAGHGQFGNIDAIGRQNIIDINPGLDLILLEHQQYVQSLTLRTSFYEFWRQSLNDAVYTAPGTVLRAPSTSKARYVGNELDFMLNWQIDRHLSSYLGYSHFFPGTFISQTGSSQGIDYVYAACAYTF